MSLTVYILEIKDGDKLRLVESFSKDMDIRFEVDREHNFTKVPDTYWKMYIYSNEWLQKQLSTAIPIFLEEGRFFDYFSLYKRDKENHIYHIPRIFKSNVLMKEKHLLPKSFDDLRGDTILNGWLEGV